MPLFEMSPNIQESVSVGRKRSHDEFSGEALKTNSASDAKTTVVVPVQPSEDALPPSTTSSRQSSPALTEPGSITPPRGSPIPESPTKTSKAQALDSTTQPSTMTSSKTHSTTATNQPAKRKRLTMAEKEAREKDLADKKKERDEKASLKAAEKMKLEEEKAAKMREKEEKRKKKEEDDRLKAEKKRQKEEEQQRVQEEKERKGRSQKTLGTFFKIPDAAKKPESRPAKPDASPIKATSTAPASKDAVSAYAKMFKPFYLKENTQLASTAVWMDEETREAKSRILDEYISGQRGHNAPVMPFDSVRTLEFASKPLQRGRLHHPVKHIMETVYKDTETSGSAGANSNDIVRAARKKLAKIPVKVIAFSRDVRPPYYGTITFKTFALGKGNMHKLARKSTCRRLPLDYDYDSEAEWQEEEEGEDVDMDDDEEELDDEDDMEEFLDDSEDAGLSRRVFANTLEPESTGICFENANRAGPNLSVYEHKMEFIQEGFDHGLGIDPFSTQYWEPEPKPAKPSRVVKLNDAEVKMPPPPAANAFTALTKVAASGAGHAKLVKAELLNNVKQAILDNKAMSKVGIVEVLFSQFRDSVSRVEVKNTLELVAEKKGSGRTKEWELRPGHEIST